MASDNMDEDRIREIIKEELANLAPQKKKRAPNKWQVFLKECVKEQSGELVYTDKVKACSVKYKENKGKIPDNLPPEQPQQSMPPVQPALPVQPEQPVQYAQPPAQSAQPTYHTQQMDVMPVAALTEEDAERLLKLTSERLAKMVRR